MLRIYIRPATTVVLYCYTALSYAQCFDINAIDIKNTIDGLQYPQIKITNQYINKCLRAEDITQLVSQLNNLYISKGYITTRLTLPQQNLSQGVLLIRVIPGYIETIKISGLNQRVKSTLPVHQGRILDLRDIEQTIDHSANSLSNNLNIALKPGENKSGTIIELGNTPEKKWQLTSMIDNNGNKSKGILQQTTALTIDNIIGTNDSLSFSHLHSLEDRDERYTKASNASFSIPFGYNKLQFLYNHATYLNHINTKSQTYRSRGNSSVVRTQLQHTLHRDNLSKTNIHLAVQYDKYNNYFAENIIALSTYKLRKWEWGFNHQRRLSSSVVSFGSSFILGKLHNYKFNLNNINTPKKQFHKFTYFTSWYKPLPIQHLSYQFSLSGQYTPTLLVPTEKQTVGGLSSVRGYKDKIENADNANIFRNELILMLPLIKSAKMDKLIGSNKLFIAYDYGKYTSYQESSKRKHGYLSGIAAGIRNESGRLIYNFTWAKALKKLGNSGKTSTVFAFSMGVKI